VIARTAGGVGELDAACRQVATSGCPWSSRGTRSHSRAPLARLSAAFENKDRWCIALLTQVEMPPGSPATA
jgi:hypothetical protein